MFYVYILESKKTGRHYIGSCGNIDARLRDHKTNQVRSTKYNGPYKLIHMEMFEFKQDALKRERQIKKYKGGRFFKKLISSSPSSRDRKSVV